MKIDTNQPLTREGLSLVASKLSETLYPINLLPQTKLAERLIKAMDGLKTRAEQDQAGSAILREIAEAKPVRTCRLSEYECARRCDALPGGCDIYGDGLESDGLMTRVEGRHGDGQTLQLDLVGVAPNGEDATS